MYNLICETCHQPFIATDPRRKNCDQCKRKTRKPRVPQAPQKRRGEKETILAKCPYCGKMHPVPASHKNGNKTIRLYCPDHEYLRYKYHVTAYPIHNRW